MDTTQFPVYITTQRLPGPRMEVYYPVVTGMQNPVVQQTINSQIFALVVKLIRDQGYYRNPATQVWGNYEIKTNEKGVLSLTVINYAFSGGAHGLTIIKSLTFDIITGKSYMLSELFKPGSDYVKVLSTMVKIQIEQRKVPLLNGFKGISPEQDYYIADKALVLYFQLYELTPYVYGFPMFPISVYSLENIIRNGTPLDKMLVNA